MSSIGTENLFQSLTISSAILATEFRSPLFQNPKKRRPRWRSFISCWIIPSSTPCLWHTACPAQCVSVLMRMMQWLQYQLHPESVSIMGRASPRPLTPGLDCHQRIKHGRRRGENYSDSILNFFLIPPTHTGSIGSWSWAWQFVNVVFCEFPEVFPFSLILQVPKKSYTMVLGRRQGKAFGASFRNDLSLKAFFI